MSLSSPHYRSSGAHSAATPASIAPALERARTTIESRFLDAGEVLALAVGGVGELVASLDRLGAALNHETVEATSAEIAAAAERLLRLAEERRDRRERLRGLQQMSMAGIEDMRRDLSYLGVFAISIKITAAGVPGAREDFALFAQEIADRVQAGRGELEAFAGALDALKTQLGDALDQEQALASQFDHLVPSIPDALAAGADEMARHHQKIGRVAAEVADLARGIQAKVGMALAALQVGDSTRQRIEHVQKGLKLAGELAAPPAARAAVMDVVHKLFSAQLAATADEFRREAGQIDQSLAGLAADANQILRLRELAFGGSATGDCFLERMTAQLAQAAELVARMEAADRTACQTGRAAAEAAAVLSRRIAALQSIKTDVQQMALNTTLKCVRIGDEGKPLAVIAIELRGHAELLEASAQSALDDIATLARNAEQLIGEEADGHAGAALADAAARLREANSGLEADVSDLARQGEAVVRALAQAASRLNLHGAIGAALEQGAAVLAEAADEPASDLALAAELLPELLTQIARSYTMAQEREVHAVIAAGIEVATPAQPVAWLAAN